MKWINYFTYYIYKFLLMFSVVKKYRLILVIILFALFASIFSLQKTSFQYAKPFFLMGFRMFFAGLVLILFEYKKLKFLVFTGYNHIKFFVLLAIFNIYCVSIFEIWGLSNMSSSKACMIYSLSPFITAVVAFFLLKEKLNIKQIIGMFLGFLGLVPMMHERSYEELIIKQVLVFSLPELALITAVFCSVIGWVLLKYLINLGYSYILANSLSMILGGILLLLHSFLFENNWSPFPVYNVPKFFLYTFIICIISNIFCYNLFGYLLKYFSTTFMTFAGLMTPFFASFFGWIFLKEKVTVYFFVSMFLFLMGLILFHREEKK